MVADGWCSTQHELIAIVDEVVERVTGISRETIPPLDGRDAAMVTVCLTGLLIQADWIASDDVQVLEGKHLVRGGLDPHGSVAAAVKWVDTRRGPLEAHVTTSLGLPLDVERDVLVDLIMGGFEPRPLQQQAIELSPPGDDAGLWIAMYPTGDGKTTPDQPTSSPPV